MRADFSRNLDAIFSNRFDDFSRTFQTLKSNYARWWTSCQSFVASELASKIKSQIYASSKQFATQEKNHLQRWFF